MSFLRPFKKVSARSHPLLGSSFLASGLCAALRGGKGRH
jgi:hypothetical protein